MNYCRLVACILFLVSVVAGPASAQTQTSPCSATERRQFDFWLGSWRVADASGKAQGTNEVTSEYGGCALQEHWKGVDGSEGSSFNSYIPGRKQWHQTWVDNGGTTLLLFGGLNGESMVMSGARVNPRTHATVLDRITWTPMKDGRVRQHWQQSPDSGKHWTDIFDGYYTKAPSN